MPALENVRHERFAQELAQGKSQTEAYLAAGYSANEEAARRAASRLLTNVDITNRVIELQKAAAVKSGVTLQWLLEQCQEIVREARENADFSAASMTVERAAKIAGLWVDQAKTQTTSEVYHIGALPPVVDADEWQTEASRH